MAAAVLRGKDSSHQSVHPAILSLRWPERAASEEDDYEAVRWVSLTAWEKTQKTSGARFARFFAENGTESYLYPADQVGQKSAQLAQEVKSQNEILILTSDSRQ